MNDVIQGHKFIEIADFIYRPERGHNTDPVRNAFNNIGLGDYRDLVNTLSGIEDGQIIYTHTFWVDQLFEILQGKRVTVVSHNCDIPASIAPPEGVTWFSSNVVIDHPRVRALPYGIDNRDEYASHIIEKSNFPGGLKNLLYIDHRIWVNPDERRKPYELLEKESWVTAVHPEGSETQDTHETWETFERYLDNLHNHGFSICAAGNGIDTRRPWEALYLGVIPVVKRNIHNLSFASLPIVYVDDWEDVTIGYLLENYPKIKDMTLLSFNYWKNLIYEDSRANGRNR